MERNHCIYLKGLKLDCILYLPQGSSEGNLKWNKFLLRYLKTQIHRYWSCGVSSIVLGQGGSAKGLHGDGPRSSGSPGSWSEGSGPWFVQPEGRLCPGPLAPLMVMAAQGLGTWP